jgi:hypothetical protein
MQAKAISLKRVLMPGLMPAPLGGDSGTTRDTREHWRYNADDAEVGGHGSGY